MYIVAYATNMDSKNIVMGVTRNETNYKGRAER